VSDERPPFGFRQDVEHVEQEPPEQARSEVSNTSCATSAAWTPVVRLPFHMGDNAPRRIRHEGTDHGEGGSDAYRS
jgi:hypothetical protein